MKVEMRCIPKEIYRKMRRQVAAIFAEKRTSTRELERVRREIEGR